MTAAAHIAERVRIDSARGRIAGVLQYPGRDEPRAATLLIPPHPLMGGRADAPLLAAIADALAEQGVATLRFDFIGAGESEGDRLDVSGAMQEFWSTGRTSEDARMIDDAFAALGWLEDACAHAAGLVGYSFGGWAASQLASTRTPSIAMLAPPFGKHPYDAFARAKAPALVVVASRDFAHNAAQLDRLVAQRTAATRVETVDTDHFFRGVEPLVAATVAAWSVAEPCDRGACA